MTFLMLKQLNATDIVEKKDRISLVLSYSLHTSLIFFRDKTFIHYDRQAQEALYSGKLPMVPTKYLPLKTKGKVVLLGLSDNNKFLAVSISVAQKYHIETRQLSNVKPESSTTFILFEPRQSDNKTFYIIRILKNIENGIALEAYDFIHDIWQEQILHLGSRFLQCILVDCSQYSQQYKQAGQIYCSVFVLLGQGERFDSINYSKLKISHQKSEDNLKLNLKFIITRQLKLKQSNFVFISGMPLPNNQMILIGNSRLPGENRNQSRQLTASLIFNTHQLQVDEPQHPNFNHIFQDKIGQDGCILFRGFIGIRRNNLLAVVALSSKKWGIAKVNSKSAEILSEFMMNRPPKFNLSIIQDCLFSVEAQLEYFFQKFKSAPSKLAFTLFKIQKKSIQYDKILQQSYPKVEELFRDLIVSLL